MNKQRALWCLAALLLGAVLPNLAQAASITVDGSTCTLADAITSANNDTATGGCPAGSGDDTITLETDVTLSDTLPQISSTMTIEGGGHFISGNDDAAVGSVLRVASEGDLTLNKVTVSGGSGSLDIGGDIVGGGIFNEGGVVTLINSTVSSNSAELGGGIHNLSGTVMLTNTTVSGNTASEGGGINNNSKDSMFTLINSTVSGNTGDYGGGILNIGGTATLTNSTVSGNTAINDGGGIMNYTESTYPNSIFILKSSLVSGNITVPFYKELYNNATVNANSFNVFGHSGEMSAEAFYGFTPSGSDVNATSDGGGTPTALDAILSTTLADNGGPTQTHALVAGSPAIDLDATCSGGEIIRDQRRYGRPVGSGCDAGAFEYGALPPPVSIVTASVGTGGSINPAGNQGVNDGETISFTVSPDSGYTADSTVGGTCPQGTWDGNAYTTGAIDADCSVVFSFSKAKTNMAPIYKLLLLK